MAEVHLWEELRRANAGVREAHDDARHAIAEVEKLTLKVDAKLDRLNDRVAGVCNELLSIRRVVWRLGIPIVAIGAVGVADDFGLSPSALASIAEKLVMALFA